MKLEHHQKFAMPVSATSRLLTVLLCTLVLGGCAVNSSRIDATDEKVKLPSVRLGINFGDGDQPASEPQSGHAIEFGGIRAIGSDNQTLKSGSNPIYLGSETFLAGAGAELKNEFDLGFGDISWRMRKFFGDRALGIDVSAGLGYSALDLKVSSTTTTQSASEHLFSRGPQAGFGLIWRLNQSSSVEGRVGGFASWDDTGVSSFTRYDLFYTKALLDNLSVRLGYTIWDVYGYTGAYKSSDFKLHFAGPVLSLNWDINASNKKITVNKRAE